MARPKEGYRALQVTVSNVSARYLAFRAAMDSMTPGEWLDQCLQRDIATTDFQMFGRTMPQIMADIMQRPDPWQKEPVSDKPRKKEASAISQVEPRMIPGTNELTEESAQEVMAALAADAVWDAARLDKAMTRSGMSAPQLGKLLRNKQNGDPVGKGQLNRMRRGLQAIPQHYWPQLEEVFSEFSFRG